MDDEADDTINKFNTRKCFLPLNLLDGF